jgi:hypothetical protein
MDAIYRLNILIYTNILRFYLLLKLLQTPHFRNTAKRSPLEHGNRHHARNSGPFWLILKILFSLSTPYRPTEYLTIASRC